MPAATCEANPLRDPAAGGFDYRPPGLDYQLDHRLIDTSAPLADRYFRFLDRIGEPGGRTGAQQAYQDQLLNRLDLRPTE